MPDHSVRQLAPLAPRRRLRAALRAALALAAAAAWQLGAFDAQLSGDTAGFALKTGTSSRKNSAVADAAADAARSYAAASGAAASSAAARRAWLDEDAPRRGDGGFSAAYATRPVQLLFEPAADAAAACEPGGGEHGIVVCAPPRSGSGALPCAAYSIASGRDALADAVGHVAFAASVRRAVAPACNVRNFTAAEAFGGGALSDDSRSYTFVTRPMRMLQLIHGHTWLAALRVDAPAYAWDLALGTEWFRVQAGQLQLRLPLADRTVAEVDELLRAVESGGFICVRFVVQHAESSLDVAFVAASEGRTAAASDRPLAWTDPIEPLIVTGASSNHARALHGLLGSIVEQSVSASETSAPGVCVHVWDLGLTPEELAALQKAFPPTDEGAPAATPGPPALATTQPGAQNASASTGAAERTCVVSFRYFTFNFSSAPKHCALTRESYAWKTEIMGFEILDSVESRGLAPVLWLDAGDRLIAPLGKILASARENGVSAGHSSGYALQWTHQLMLSFFEARHWMRKGDLTPGHTPCASGLIVFDRDNARTISRIVRRWHACGVREACIAPLGSSRANHRQDQAALTLLFIAARVPKGCSYDSPLGLDIVQHSGGR